MSEQTEGHYRPDAVEAKWQARWAERGTNAPDLDRAPNPFYNLMMFPYPSAEGLHVGNFFAFTGADVYGRFKRLQGHQVFEPIGYDAFGIHSENFAIKIGTHPAELIPRNIANFRRQLTSLGGMFDWRHELATTAPGYYKWTQWLVLQLYRAGVAYKKRAAVNWCPRDKTGLANEQVIDGACERCGTQVEQRLLEQWFFRITDYAERLLANLDDPAKMDWSASTTSAQRNWIGRSEGAEIEFATDAGPLRVFTTRPDTLFGATFMVLAPEHPLVEALTTPAARSAVEDYRKAAAAKGVVARKVGDKDKSGVATGGFALNPATGERIPVWGADYVLMEYGTGAIMAVPGHDERDFAFATRYRLPIVRALAGRAETGATPLPEAAIETEGFRLVNSGAFSELPVTEAIATIIDWLEADKKGQGVVQYRLYDWCISRQRYWGPPIPIVYCDACGIVPVPESELPVLLPRVEDYRPDQSGVSPLARVESWYRVPCPECGAEARRETDVSDTFLDSAWYFLRYPSSNRDDVAFDEDVTRKWLPVDMYIGGEEHSVLHLMYARFITMALHDLAIVDFDEPFTTFRKHGLLIREGSEISKSRGNVVVPDDYIERWGADTFRTYLMFLGPYQEGGDFRDEGLMGPYGFLNRLWNTVLPVDALGDAPLAGAIVQKRHATIRKVSEAIGSLSYNTAIAALMEYLNAVREGGRRANRAEVEPLVVLVAPFAPHIAEELWQSLGHTES